MQGMLLATLTEEDHVLKEAFHYGATLPDVRATTKSIGIVFPKQGEEGGITAPIRVLAKETAVPCRRTVRFDADLGPDDHHKIAFELWELEERIHVEKVKPPGFTICLSRPTSPMAL